ncbi:hypothetical protein MBLNU13_g08239t1 [Cladosporium sp. NU13]
MEPGSESEAVPEGLCVPQAKGNYHLSFSSSRMCVPALAAGGISGCSGGPGWKLFDWNCKMLEIHYFPGKPINVKHSWQSTYNSSHTSNYDDCDYSTKSNGLCGSRTQDPGLAIVGESRVGFAGPLPCMLKSVRDSPSGSVTTDPALRTPQNAGNIQYTMETADPPTISIYDSECREVALFRRETAPDYCPWPIKIDYLGEGRDMTIPKWDANQHIFAFEFRGRTYEAGFTKTLNDVRGGLREYASRSGVYVLWKRKFFVTSELVL